MMKAVAASKKITLWLLAFLFIHVVVHADDFSREDALCEQQDITWLAEEVKDIIVLVCQEYEDAAMLAQLHPELIKVYYDLKAGKEPCQEELVKAAHLLMVFRSTGLLPLILEKVCAILASVEGDFNPVFTLLAEQQEILCDKFQQTWTIFDNFLTPTSIVSTQKDFENTFTALDQMEEILCQKFLETWTILPTTQPTPINAPMVISQSGSYCLNQDIVGTITIATSCVQLDLNNKQIDANGGNGISVASQSTIIIENGYIANAASAVAIDSSSNIKISALDFIGNNLGVSAATTTFIQIDYCTFRAGTNGIRFMTCTGGSVSDCKFTQHSSTVISLSFSSACFLFKNIAICNNTITSGNLIAATNSVRNIFFDRILINNNSSSGTLIPFFIPLNNVHVYNSSICCNQAASNFKGINVFGCTVLDNIEISNNRSTGGSVTGIALEPGTGGFEDVLNAQNITINNNKASTTFEGIANLSPDVFQECTIENCSINNNSSNGASSGIHFMSSKNITLREIFIANNSAAVNASNTFDGVRLNGCSQATLGQCTVFGNTSPTCRGLYILGTSINMQVLDSNFSDQVGGSDCFGVRIEGNPSNMYFDHCTSLRNTSTQTNARGIGFSVSLILPSSINVTFESCIANGNNALAGGVAARGYGFHIVQSRNFEILNCIAKHNSSSGTGSGIFLEGLNGRDFIVKNCILNGNTGLVFGAGISSVFSYGIMQYTICNDNFDNGIQLAADYVTLEGNICNNHLDAANGQGIAVSGGSGGGLNVVKGNICNYNREGIRIPGTSTFSAKNLTQNNSSVGIVDPNGVGGNNSYTNNTSQRNGATGTSNYSGTLPTRAALLNTFNVGAGTFTGAAGPLNIFSNLNVLP
ncbi:MAG: right-handed parallel beta-helix repeat-containing protein [Candidatus Babeliales bacterium]